MCTPACLLRREYLSSSTVWAPQLPLFRHHSTIRHAVDPHPRNSLSPTLLVSFRTFGSGAGDQGARRARRQARVCVCVRLSPCGLVPTCALAHNGPIFTHELPQFTEDELHTRPGACRVVICIALRTEPGLITCCNHNLDLRARICK